MDSQIDSLKPAGTISVLVVDDEPACRLAVQDCLASEGMYVQTEGRAEDALRFLEVMRPSAVIIDYGLPGMSGLELLVEIRSMPSLRNIPVIMITAAAEADLRLKVLAAGVDDFLSKPFDPSELQLRLRNLLRLQNYRRAVEERNRTLEEEVALRTSQVVQQAEVVQSVADAIISTDPDFRVRTWNRGAEAMYGLRVESVVGRNLFGVLRTDWLGESEALMNEALQDGGRWVGELSQAALAGRPVRVRASVTRLLGVDGEVSGYALVNHDLTEQTQARLLMAQAASISRETQRLESLGALTRGIAHDFNNWLAVIKGYTSMLLEEMDEGDGQTDDLKVVLEASASAGDLVQQLLAFSRQQVLAPEVVDLNDLVRRVGRLLQRVLTESVRLKQDLATDLPRVCIDVGQMDQVIMNLAVNARDAMPNGGMLTLGTHSITLEEDEARLKNLEPGRYVVLSVRDTGIGMDEEMRIRVFEPFFTTKGPDRGTGLGLSSVYGIIRQSGGQIFAESVVGEGSCFRAFIPVSERAPNARSSPPAPSRVGHADAVSGEVWIVEDQDRIRSMLGRSLSNSGLKIKMLATGEEALQLMQDDLPDLLVTDVSMPGISGIELAEQARTVEPDLRVLFVTGYWQGPHPAESPEDPTYLLNKPFTPQELRARVQQILASPSPS